MWSKEARMSKLRDRMNKYEPSESVKMLNPEIYGKIDKDRMKTWMENPLPVKGLEKFKISKGEEAFIKVWKDIGGQEYIREYKFHPTRRFRIDFYFPQAKLGIEVDGGNWSGGRHVRGQGFEDDCEKKMEALFLGIYLSCLTIRMITSDNLQRYKKFIEETQTTNK